MKTFNVKCQVNANNETVIVVVDAISPHQAWSKATEVVNARKGQGNIRGCIVMSVEAAA